ncbi:hypothetical protein [Candidatus Phytoplasma sp. AldY-WA1]|uniref:hypothetical protein n=1 Tax=Candidatus Phytoplasma sp. AldY-WA1 TaxID=2852100 RepID=UPI00254BD3EA|nr:hypothetical protein [Candidatus Phytoplasma sp. AldY-WA1]
MNINLLELLLDVFAKTGITIWLCYSINNLKKDLKSKSNDLKDLKTDFNRLNDKIDKIDNDNKLNDKKLELLEKEMLYHRENLDKIKKINQETKDTTTETFKKIEKLIDNNNKKNNI